MIKKRAIVENGKLKIKNANNKSECINGKMYKCINEKTYSHVQTKLEILYNNTIISLFHIYVSLSSFSI